jgi:hypothetical protein
VRNLSIRASIIRAVNARSGRDRLISGAFAVERGIA